MTDTALADGHIVGIAGPVIDAEFPTGELPQINTALEFDVEIDGTELTIVAEVAQQIGDSRVRAIAMKPTDGLTRGTVVRNTGAGISVPVGDSTLGHVFSVTGQGLVDAIVHDLVDHVMETGTVIGIADIHSGSLADSI